MAAVKGEIVGLAFVLRSSGALGAVDGAPYTASDRALIGDASSTLDGRVVIRLEPDTAVPMRPEARPAIRPQSVSVEAVRVTQFGALEEATILLRIRIPDVERAFRAAGWDVTRWGVNQSMWFAQLRGKGAELRVAPFGTSGPRPLQGIYDVQVAPVDSRDTILVETMQRVLGFIS